MGKVTIKSILEMCNGAFQERADYEMSRLIENIMDVNLISHHNEKAVCIKQAAFLLRYILAQDGAGAAFVRRT